MQNVSIVYGSSRANGLTFPFANDFIVMCVRFVQAVGVASSGTNHSVCTTDADVYRCTCVVFRVIIISIHNHFSVSSQMMRHMLLMLSILVSLSLADLVSQRNCEITIFCEIQYYSTSCSTRTSHTVIVVAQCESSNFIYFVRFDFSLCWVPCAALSLLLCGA